MKIQITKGKWFTKVLLSMALSVIGTSCASGPDFGLYMSMTHRNKAKIEEAVNFENIDPHYKDMHGYTHLMRAALHGDLNVAKLAVKKGANIEEKDKYGTASLFIACAHGHENVARFLLKKGANVNVSPTKTYNFPKMAYAKPVKLEVGTTPLMLSIARGFSESTSRKIMEAGADINAQTESKWSALHYAAFTWQLELANSLMINGAKVYPLESSASGVYSTGAINLLKAKNYEEEWDIEQAQQYCRQAITSFQTASEEFTDERNTKVATAVAKSILSVALAVAAVNYQVQFFGSGSAPYRIYNPNSSGDFYEDMIKSSNELVERSKNKLMCYEKGGGRAAIVNCSKQYVLPARKIEIQETSVAALSDERPHDFTTIKLVDRPFHVGDDDVDRFANSEPQGVVFKSQFDLPDTNFSNISITIWVSHMVPKYHKQFSKGYYKNKLVINDTEICILNKYVPGEKDKHKVRIIKIELDKHIFMKGTNKIEIIAGSSRGNHDDFEIRKIIVEYLEVQT